MFEYSIEIPLGGLFSILNCIHYCLTFKKFYMKKTEIIVPSDLEYISDWKTYELPKGHCIVDKGVTGCGYTEYCISNKYNVILCSPRKLLLENKYDQHQGEDNIFYLRNELENYNNVSELEDKLRNHILNCNFKGKPVKILVTYDSSYLIIDFLKEFKMLNNFYFIVDEFQSIFLDSYFKSEIENDFVNYLQDCPNVLYLSATPMLDKYLEKLDEFKDLDFYQLNWKNSRYTEMINIQRKRTNSLGHECKRIIESYLKGKFNISLDENKKLVESKEAVFYFNSISDIIRVVKSMNLIPSNTNIICSDTPENKQKLKKIGFKISGVPLKGEPNKMFTFCTRSVYIGADFYSNCASSYIFADPNINCLALDISLDLPQIVGRQRNRNNPFKNNIIIFYKTIQGQNIKDRHSFDLNQFSKKENSNAILNLFKKGTKLERINLITKLKDSIEVSNYSNDFISISKKTGEPVYNSFIEIANERAWEVAQEDYQDQINVTRSLIEEGYTQQNFNYEEDKILKEFLDNKFYNTGIFREKMKLFCEFMDKYKDNKYIIDSIIHKVDPKFKTFYDLYGTEGCRSVSYEEANLRERSKDRLMSSDLKTKLISTFRISFRYTLKDIKLTLELIYKELRVPKTPKASDLKEYFEVSEVKIADKDTGKRSKGYEILGIK